MEPPPTGVHLTEVMGKSNSSSIPPWIAASMRERFISVDCYNMTRQQIFAFSQQQVFIDSHGSYFFTNKTPGYIGHLSHQVDVARGGIYQRSYGDHGIACARYI